MSTALRVLTGNVMRGVGLDDLSGITYDWTDTNLPWAYDDEAEFTEGWPSDTVIVDLSPTGANLDEKLNNTINGVAGGGRVVVRLPEGVHHLTSFRMIGGSGSVTYAFGFWFPRLQGLLGHGADNTVVQMDANSVNSDQLAAMQGMDPTLFAPLQMGMCRFDGTEASPVLLAGLTFRAADQQNLTAVHPNLAALGIVTPQPAPHQGVVFYGNWTTTKANQLHAKVNHVRFQGAGRAVYPAPPFEMCNATSQYGNIIWKNCEFDGRRSAALDPARPRRCTVWMGNNEFESVMQDCWLHHTNVSRYASNDENRDYSGSYTLRRCKIEQIGNQLNVDPALNGGNSLGGWSAVTPIGWESSNATMLIEDCIIHQDNPYTKGGQVPMHFQMTIVGSRNPVGGRLTVRGTEFHNSGFPQLEGYVCARVGATSHFRTDGYATTMQVYHRDGQRLTAYELGPTFPPTLESLASAGVTPATHYLIKLA